MALLMVRDSTDEFATSIPFSVQVNMFPGPPWAKHVNSTKSPTCWLRVLPGIAPTELAGDTVFQHNMVWFDEGQLSIIEIIILYLMTNANWKSKKLTGLLEYIMEGMYPNNT